MRKKGFSLCLAAITCVSLLAGYVRRTDTRTGGGG